MAIMSRIFGAAMFAANVGLGVFNAMHGHSFSSAVSFAAVAFMVYLRPWYADDL